MKPSIPLRRTHFGIGLWLASLLLAAPEGARAQSRAGLPPIQYRLMHLSPADRMRMIQAHLAAPVLAAPASPRGYAAAVNLLPHVPYVPVERDQGYCGDCWQWAGTGVMEVAHDVQDGIFDRLSVQFLNSCQVEKFCCDGGWLQNVSDFYTFTRTYAIPWTNANAAFTSYSGDCNRSPCSSIATTPRYPLQTITTVTIPTWGVGQSQAIANIKNALDGQKAVFFAFFLPDLGWSAFDSFWMNSPESTVWTNFYCGVGPSSSGHAVLCVGYNDDGGANRYWVILNSWGVTGLRPTGLFRVSMDLDYDCVDTGGFQSLTCETLDLQFTPTAPIIHAQPQSQTVALDSSATFAVNATSPASPITYQWRKQGSPITGATGSAYTIDHAKFSDAGTYSVVVGNPYTSVTSGDATLTVVPPVSLPFALNNSTLTWTTDTNVFWYGQTNLDHDGVAAAQSYPLSNNQRCSLRTTLTGPGTLNFVWKVSSQPNVDILSFAAATVGWSNYLQISGSVDWTQQTVLLPPGTLSLEWVYAKDAAGSAGLDAGWLDQVSYVPGCTSPHFVMDPASQCTLAAQPATFSVQAQGTPTLAYQWLFNGAEIPGATATTLTLTNPGIANRGRYSARAINCCSGVESAGANLSVVPLVARGDNSFGQIDFSMLASNAVGIAAGAWHSLVLCADGSLVTWGENYCGQCNVPVGLRDILTVAAGGYHSLALVRNSTVAAWGDNAYGQLQVPPGLSNVTAIAAGAWHSLALRANGTVVAWGDDSFGQCDVPTGLTDVIAVAAGGNHSLALRRDGTVVAWGENTDAEGNFTAQSVVPWGLASVVAIGAGDYHSLAIRADGSVVGWGDNSRGQCQPPTDLTNAIAVVGGGAHTVALRADTTVSAWGEPYQGACNLPCILSNIVALAAGNADTILLQGNSSAPPQFLRPARAGNQFSALVQTFHGKNYALESKNALTGANWSQVMTLRGNGALQVLADPTAGGTQRFYRIRRW